MERRYSYSFLLSIFFLISVNSIAQNLVPNPSFELQTECPTHEGKIDFALPWFSSGITPDLFSSCDSSINSFSTPSNSLGYQLPRNGNAFAGLFVGSKGSANGREYLSVELLDNLHSGRKYLLRFFVSLADSSTAGLSTMGMQLSNQKNISNDGFIYDSSHVKKRLKSAVVDKNTWIEVSDTITASGNERYITIGNFVPDSLIDYCILDSTPDMFFGLAYYFIDDVLVVDVDSLESLTTDINAPKEEGLTSRVKVFPNPTSAELYIYCQLQADEELSVGIYDLQGRLVAEKVGSDSYVLFDLSAIASGVYVCKTSTSLGFNETERIVINK